MFHHIPFFNPWMMTYSIDKIYQGWKVVQYISIDNILYIKMRTINGHPFWQKIIWLCNWNYVFSILWTTSLSSNEDHSSKTKQIKSQGIFTLFWQLITHFASQFHQSIYKVALEFTDWRNLFWYVSRLINQIIFCNDWFLIAVLVPFTFQNLKR